MSRNAACMLLVILFTATAPLALAQDRYRECQKLAKRESGYSGPVPDKYLPGGAVKGAVKGAAVSAIINASRGDSKEKIKKKAKRNARIGALMGGIKRGLARKELGKRQRRYQAILDQCMQETSDLSVSSLSRDTRSGKEAGGPSPAAAPEPGRLFDVKALSCWEIVSADDASHAAALLLGYGYVAGERNESVQTAERIEGVLSGFERSCGNPSQPIVDVIKAATASPETATAGRSSFDLAQFSCWEFMTLPEEDQDMLGPLLYGFAAGRSRKSTHDTERIEKAFSRAVGECRADGEVPMAVLLTVGIQ